MSEFSMEAVPFGNNISAEDISGDLEFFDDWEERYRYIIDLGKQLPEFPEQLKTEDRFVRGCQSQVWLETRYSEDDGRIHLAVDSDALIVRGLAAIVLSALNNKTPEQILACDMEAFFSGIDLLNHLSPTRGNGVRSMVERIKSEAARHAHN